MQTITDFFRDVKYTIMNHIRWHKVLKDDRDWDYIYFLIVMRHKIESMQELHKTTSMIADDTQKIIADMGKAIKLLDRLIEDNYGYSEEDYKDQKLDLRELFELLADEIPRWWD